MPFFCWQCGGNGDEPEHWRHCDAHQGTVEAATPDPEFDGETYDAARDHDRLFAQLGRVRTRLFDHHWHTLASLSAATGDPEASISARLRDLRKPKFGGYTVARRYVSEGLWEYRLEPVVAEDVVEAPTCPPETTDA